MYYDADGNKIKQEDFASLAHKTALTHGRDFKYTGSYEDAAAVLRANVSAWQVEMARFKTNVLAFVSRAFAQVFENIKGALR